MKIPTVFTMFLMTYSIAVPDWRCADDVGNDVTSGTLNVSWTNQNASFNNSAFGVSKRHIDYWTSTEAFTNTNLSDFSETGTPTNGPTVSSLYDPTEACLSRNGSVCQNIEFTPGFETIVSEWSMVCDTSWVPSMIASIQMAGIFVGHIISGQLADTFGRKFPLFGSCVLLIVSNTMAYLSQGWLLFGIARTLCGFGMGVFLTVQYSLASEVTTASWRAWVIAFPSWATEGCMFAVVAYLLADWRHLHLMTILVTVPFLLLWRVVPDSFRWYMSHDRSKDATGVIKYIARVNRVHLSDSAIEPMMKGQLSAMSDGDNVKYSFIHLLKTRTLVKITLLLSLNWFNLGLMTYGIQFGLQALSGSFYLNMFLFNAIGIPSTFLPIVLVNRIGRRLTVAFTYSVASFGSLVVGLIPYLGLEDSLADSLTNIFAFVSSVGISMSWGPVQLLTLELYPTVIRNIGYGSLNMLARVGAVIAPQLAYMDTQVPGIMYFVCCGVSIGCVVCTLGLSETRGAELPDKIDTTSKTAAK